MNIVCKECGKSYDRPDADVGMRGHVLRNHPHLVPDRVKAIADNPTVLAEYRAKNGPGPKWGMFDRLLRAVDRLLGKPLEPLVFPDGDVVLSTGVRLAYKGRALIMGRVLQRWEGDGVDVSVSADNDPASGGRHVSIKGAAAPPTPETVAAVRVAFLRDGEEDTGIRLASATTLHLLPDLPSDLLDDPTAQVPFSDIVDAHEAPVVTAPMTLPARPEPYYDLPKKGKTFVREDPKIGRNEPCPCNSGKKYKKCHGVTA